MYWIVLFEDQYRLGILELEAITGGTPVPRVFVAGVCGLEWGDGAFDSSY